MKRKNETLAEYYERRKPQQRAYFRQRYQDKPETVTEQVKRWRKNNPRKAKSISMRQAWRERGVKHIDGAEFTLDDYDIMFAYQRGRCAICSRHQSELRHALNVDHNHETGVIRGLLCSGCNTRLAVFEDKEFMTKCRRYLGA